MQSTRGWAGGGGGGQRRQAPAPPPLSLPLSSIRQPNQPPPPSACLPPPPGSERSERGWAGAGEEGAHPSPHLLPQHHTPPSHFPSSRRVSSFLPSSLFPNSRPPPREGARQRARGWVEGGGRGWAGSAHIPPTTNPSLSSFPFSTSLPPPPRQCTPSKSTEETSPLPLFACRQRPLVQNLSHAPSPPPLPKSCPPLPLPAATTRERAKHAGWVGWWRQAPAPPPTFSSPPPEGCHLLSLSHTTPPSTGGRATARPLSTPPAPPRDRITSPRLTTIRIPPPSPPPTPHDFSPSAPTHTTHPSHSPAPASLTLPPTPRPPLTHHTSNPHHLIAANNPSTRQNFQYQPLPPATKGRNKAVLPKSAQPFPITIPPPACPHPRKHRHAPRTAPLPASAYRQESKTNSPSLDCRRH